MTKVLCLKQGPRNKFTQEPIRSDGLLVYNDSFFYELTFSPYFKRVTKQIFICSCGMLAAYLFHV